jgi:D-alanyl-D-alanine carboxypeptidase
MVDASWTRDGKRVGWAAAAAWCIAIVFGLSLLAANTASPAMAKPQFAAIAVDARNGKVLFSIDPDGLRHPASLTKVMTLYLLFEDLKSGKITLSTPLTVSKHSAAMAPSKLGLKPGSTISVDNAIRAIVTKSANDVASTIGENLGGTESAFAARMTKTARALGMSKSTFRNASGLPDPAQYTTARDMATLSLRIQRDFPEYYPYFRIMAFTYKGQTIRTHNRLLGKYDGADGIKTGYIAASGFNLTSSARRGDKRVVGVVLGAKSGVSRNAYMMAMHDKAFPQCKNGKTIAAMAGSSKGALEPLSTNAATGAKVKVPAAADADQQVPAISDDQSDALANTAAAASADEDAADPSAETTGSTFKTVAATKPKVIEAKIGDDKSPEKLPFAVKPPAKQSDVEQVPAEAHEPSWNVQVGAFDNKKDAQNKLLTLRKSQPKLLKDKLAFTVTVQKGEQTSYRARFSGFTEADAKALCGKLSKQKVDCQPMPPQS